MNNLSIESYRKLTKQQKDFLKEKYPEVLDFYNKKNQKAIDYRFFENLKQNTKQCNINNLKYITRNQLIKCLKKKYPIFNLIEKQKKVQFKQFLYLFFRCIVYGYKEHYLKNTNQSYLEPEASWSKNNIVYCKGPPKNKHYSRNRRINDDGTINLNSSLPLFTTQQFINMTDILYPNFRTTNPDNFAHLIFHINDWDMFPQIDYRNELTPNDLLIGPDKLRNYLLYIGDSISKQAFDNPNLYTKVETEKYKWNFNFTASQINNFLKQITREQYLKILEYPEI